MHLNGRYFEILSWMCWLLKPTASNLFKVHPYCLRWKCNAKNLDFGNVWFMATSFRAWYLVIRPGARFQMKTCEPRASTWVPQTHTRGMQTLLPSRRPTVTRMDSSSRRRPHKAMGRAWSQSPLCEAATARAEKSIVLQCFFSTRPVNTGALFTLPVFTGCEHGCRYTLPVFTARVHGPWTRVVCTGLKRLFVQCAWPWRRGEMSQTFPTKSAGTFQKNESMGQAYWAKIASWREMVPAADAKKACLLQIHLLHKSHNRYQHKCFRAENTIKMYVRPGHLHRSPGPCWIGASDPQLH